MHFGKRKYIYILWRFFVFFYAIFIKTQECIVPQELVSARLAFEV